MSKIALTPNASGSGTFTLASPNSDTDRTLTLPDEAGTILTTSSDVVAGPLFSAYSNVGNTVVSNTTYTKVQMNVIEHDTNNCYSTANYRFTPNVAGYYSITISTQTEVNVSTLQRSFNELWKNGSDYKRGTDVNTNASFQVVSTFLVYMNGTTDYLEPYIWVQNSGTPEYRGLEKFTWWSGHLVRGS